MKIFAKLHVLLNSISCAIDAILQVLLSYLTPLLKYSEKMG